MEQTPSAGRIVHYFPGTHPDNKLPNGMTVAPAIIVQVLGEHCNIQLFLAEPNAEKARNPLRWSVQHKSAIGNADMPYWDWPERL